MVYRLPTSFINKIDSLIENAFERLKARYLSPKFSEKRLLVGYKRELSLPGLYESASIHNRSLPNLEALNGLARTASNYIDSAKFKAKAQIMSKVNSFMSEASLPEGQEESALIRKLTSEIENVWNDATVDLKRIITTENQRVQNFGTLEGIVKVTSSVGITDPTILMIGSNDSRTCKYCYQMYFLEDKLTPKAWKLSEFTHDYYVRGTNVPSITGCHPNCRHYPTVCMPGFGLKGGRIVWIGQGYDLYKDQRNL